MTLKKVNITKNGVDVGALEATCAAIKEKPELGQAYFRVRNTWEDGAQNQIHIAGFYAAGEEQARKEPYNLQADEAPVLLGNDSGPNPVEYLLTALSSCMTTSIIYHAAARGIEIESLHSEFTGDLDLRGFLNLGDVPKGYKKIEATFYVKTEASIEELEKLYHYSPVYSMVSKAVTIEVKFVKE